MNRQEPFGKQIENNIVRSLRMNGIAVRTGANLDHNYKIDFVMTLGRQEVGVQFTLTKGNAIKAKVAKICARDAVPRFIYLSMSPGFFTQPDRANGKVLHQFLSKVADRYPQRALSVSIDNRGPRIQSL